MRTVSKNGNPTFVYRINNATEAELATYKAFKGATYRSEIQEVNGQISRVCISMGTNRFRLNSRVLSDTKEVILEKTILLC